MKQSELIASLEHYEATFQQFVRSYQLPMEWFRNPDHFAVKCADGIDYLATCDVFQEEVEGGVWEAELDDRMLASAALSGVVALAGFSFEWVEIMQPKPGKELERGFVEHTEFTVPDFHEVLRVLDMHGVEGVEEQGDAEQGHTWINVPIDGAGREIKFNDRPLAEVVAKELEEGKMHRVVTNGH